MQIPREFHALIAATDAILLQSFDKKTTIFDLLEKMSPIIESPLRYNLPSVNQYVTACDALLTEFTKMFQIFDDILMTRNWSPELVFDINWTTSVEWCDKSPDWGALNLRLAINWSPVWLPSVAGYTIIGVQGTHDYEELLLSEQTFAIPLQNLRELTMSRLSPFKEHVYRMNASMIYLKHYRNCNDHVTDDIFQDILLKVRERYAHISSETRVPAFDFAALEREANEFRTRALLNSRVGKHAADHVKFLPGNSGFREAQTDFLRLNAF